METNVAFLASDVGRLFRKRFDVVARHLGATGPQWRMLGAIHRWPGINQGALAAWLEVEPITAGRMIDRLEKSGLVKRCDDPNDRRAWCLYLSEQAQEQLEQMGSFARDVVKEAVSDLSPAEHELLLSMLGRVREKLLAVTCGDAQDQGGLVAKG